jgi:hypothetical protein
VPALSRFLSPFPPVRGKGWGRGGGRLSALHSDSFNPHAKLRHRHCEKDDPAEAGLGIGVRADFGNVRRETFDALHSERKGYTGRMGTLQQHKRLGEMSTLQQTGRFRGRQRRGGSLPRGALSAKKIVAQIIDPMDIGATFVDDCAQTYEQEHLPSEKCRSKWSHFYERGFLVLRIDGSPITTAGSVERSGKMTSLEFEMKGGWNSPAGGQTFKNESPNRVLIAATRTLPLALGTGGKRTGGETRNIGNGVARQARSASAGAGRGPGSQTPALALQTGVVELLPGFLATPVCNDLAPMIFRRLEKLVGCALRIHPARKFGRSDC